MQPSDHSVESLIASASFQQWCLQPDQALRAEWDHWGENNPTQKAMKMEARQWVLALASQVSSQEMDQARAQLLASTFATQSTTVVNKPLWSRKPVVLWGSIAATILCLVMATWAWQRPTSPALMTYQTDFGETQIVRLPDGTQCTLNASSKLTYEREWTEREVWLEGEAYLDVYHDPSNPFLLHTPKGTVKVLGTQFNVLNREETLSVTLVEGKVALSLADRQQFTLLPGDEVALMGDQVSQRQVDLNTVSAWKDDRMVFKNATIEEIVQRLKWEFNTEVTVQRPEIMSKRVQAVLQQNDPDLLLNALAEIYELQIIQLGEHTYVIK